MSTYNADETAKVKHLILLAQAINDKIDGAGSGTDTDSRATPTLSISKTSWSIATDTNFGDWGFQTAVTYNGDGDVYVQNAQGADFRGYVTYDGNTMKLYTEQTNVTNPQTQTLKLKSTATDNYKAAEFQFTVTPKPV